MPVAKFREVAAPVDDFFRATLPPEIVDSCASASEF